MEGGEDEREYDGTSPWREGALISTVKSLRLDGLVFNTLFQSKITPALKGMLVD